MPSRLIHIVGTISNNVIHEGTTAFTLLLHHTALTYPRVVCAVFILYYSDFFCG